MFKIHDQNGIVLEENGDMSNFSELSQNSDKSGEHKTGEFCLTTFFLFVDILC